MFINSFKRNANTAQHLHFKKLLNKRRTILLTFNLKSFFVLKFFFFCVSLWVKIVRGFQVFFLLLLQPTELNGKNINKKYKQLPRVVLKNNSERQNIVSYCRRKGRRILYPVHWTNKPFQHPIRWTPCINEGVYFT